MTVERDMLSPREVADRVGLSYHAVLRAIKRGDLEAVELVSGRLRVRAAEYERWCLEGVRKQRQAAPVARRRPDVGGGMRKGSRPN